MWERLKFAFSIFWRIVNDKAFSRRLRKTLARNMEAIEDNRRALERDVGAVRLLSALQREGRLIDFLKEDVSGYADDQIGAAARDIHGNCRKALAKLIEVEKVMDKPEGSSITIPEDFDPSSVRLVGEVGGKPPFKGALRHHGWRAATVKLPAAPEGSDPNILAPAEVEVGAV